MNERQAEEIARTEYGLEVRAERLPSYAGENFLLEAEDGTRYLFKSASDTDPDDHLDLQNRVLTRLAAHPISVATPKLFYALDGREIVPADVGAERPARIRVVSYLPGRAWAHTDRPSPDLLRDLGRAVAELDVVLREVTHPAAETDFDWRPQNATRLGRWIPLVDSAERQAIADRFLHLLTATFRRYRAGLRRSVIHGDLNRSNFLFAPDSDETQEDGGEAKVSGIIDFGDVTASYTVFDPAIAAAYACLACDDLHDTVAAIAEVAAGYHEISPLEDDELAAFFPFVCGRLVQSAVHAARRRAEGQDDPYIFRSEAGAWKGLEILSAVTPAKALAMIRDACGLSESTSSVGGRSIDRLLEARKQLLGANLSLAYDQPLEMVRGVGQYLYDSQDRPYLDLVNNVAHVGHCHPRVVAAGAEQMAQLNTNTRYLHETVLEYSRRLCATLPDPLEVCFFVCSGSEANELAIRLARTHTGRQGLVVLDSAYHGHTGALIGASPYKFSGPGGAGRPADHIHVAPMPDGYRGPHRGAGPETGAAYAADLEKAIADMDEPLAGFLCEPILGCGGQIVPPEGFLNGAYDAVRRAGGVCIADEVQAGFGRVGTHFWSFEAVGGPDLVPDIVVLGKSIGNGHPMGAVVTTREIAASFDNGMEFFSTCGGNPVSAAIGLAVLDVIQDEGLQERALQLGQLLRDGLEELKSRHDLIGDVRGRGLFAGIELVRDRQTLEPAAEEAKAIVEELKESGILLSTDGPFHNVLKIKPPMVVDEEDVGFLVRGLERLLVAHLQ